MKANATEYAEIDYYPITPTDKGRTMMNWPSMIYQWHQERFSLPLDATLLITGDEYPNQTIRYGDNAYGVQFNAKLTIMMMNRWTILGAQSREQNFLGRSLYDGAVKQWLNSFLDLWIGAPADHLTNHHRTKTL